MDAVLFLCSLSEGLLDVKISSDLCLLQITVTASWNKYCVG